MFRMHKIHFSSVYILKCRPKSHFGNRRFKYDNSTCVWKRKCNSGINKSETLKINLLVNLVKKWFFMDPEYPHPDSKNLAVGFYLNQLNPVYPDHRINFNNLHSTSKELSSFNSHRVFSLQNLIAFITIQMSATFPTLLIWLYEGIIQIQ